jgi:AbiJ N-terminal domain 4
MPSFSERLGLAPPDAEITIRHEAPDWLRDLVVRLAYEKAELKPSDLRGFLCQKLLTSSDHGNWTEHPNIDREVRQLIAGAEWYYIYDLIEWVYQKQAEAYGFGPDQMAAQFESSINDCFRRKGVGWRMSEGRVEIRGAEIFEQVVSQAISLTLNSGREVARRELHEALRDLSRRPDPEVTGSIQHAMAALECVARDVTKEPKLTLGEWLKKNPSLFPQPLGAGIEKMWGYASQYGRHVVEGKPADFNEAELIVGLAGALSVYLLRKNYGVEKSFEPR